MRTTKDLISSGRAACKTRWLTAIAVAALSSAAMAQTADTGMTISKDPVTGQLRAPTPDEAAALRSQAAPQQSSKRAAPSALRLHSNGMASMMLDESHMNYSVAVRNADGSITEDCVVGSQAATDVLSGKKSIAPKRVAKSSKEHTHELR